MGSRQFILHSSHPSWRSYSLLGPRYTQFCHHIPFPRAYLIVGRIGGWVGEKKEVDFANFIKPNLADEIDQAFANCDYNLRHAGGKGFSQVYKVVTYCTDIKSQ